MRNRDLFYKIAFVILLLLLCSLCSFFIVHNAAWLIGDDAIVVRHTGFGRPFIPKDAIFSESGRFFPSAYLMYNILLPFNDGFISPAVHYGLHSICYVLCILNFTILVLCILKKVKPYLKYALAFCSAVIITGRTLPNFLECFSTVWFGYYLSSLFILSVYLFYEKGSAAYAVLALLVANFSIYRGETGFIDPLVLGLLLLVFKRGPDNKTSRWFSWALVASGLLFLAIYATAILPNITDRYDSSHGSSISMLKNALDILISQKIILVSIPFALYRFWVLVSRRQAITFFDLLYLTAWATCCGGFILKLNWVLYYNISAIYMLLFVLYCCISFNWKPIFPIVIFCGLALFYGQKIPESISLNQNKRLEMPTRVANLSGLVREDNAVWFDPKVSSYQHTQSVVLKDWIVTQLAWEKQQKDFNIPSADSLMENSGTNVVLLSVDDVKYAEERSIISEGMEPFFVESGIAAYLLR